MTLAEQVRGVLAELGFAPPSQVRPAVLAVVRDELRRTLHLPGQHNQETHGNGVNAAKDYAIDAFEELYGPIVDEATAGYLVVSVHDNGDFVLSSMDDDGRRVVVLDGLDSDRANSIADGLEWAANEEIPEGSENNPKTRLVDWEYFEDDIVIGYDSSGDVSVRLPKGDGADPDNIDDFNVVDLGVEEAADLVEALRDMADRYDELEAERSAAGRASGSAASLPSTGRRVEFRKLRKETDALVGGGGGES